MFSDQYEAPKFDDWIAVYETGSEVDAQMVKSFLQSREIDVQILSKRDSAYNLNVGDMAVVYVYVPKDVHLLAEEALKEWVAGEIELPDTEENE